MKLKSFMKDKKNIILIGRGTIAVNCLNILKKTQNLPKIIICDSQDNGIDTWTKSLFKRAKELGYKENTNLFRQTKVNDSDFIKIIKEKESNIDIIFSIQPKAIFKIPFIKLAKDYVINLHFAPLPKLRGVAPCSWAFLDGLKNMGVTLHLIKDEGIDNGPIIFQKLFPIKDDDNAWTLFNKCIKYGTKLFEENILNILKKNINPISQNEKEATYHPMGQFDYSRLEVDLNQDINSVFNFIRARIFPPFQLPYFNYQGKKIGILEVIKTEENKEINKKVVFNNNSFLLFFKKRVIVIKRYKYL